MTNMDHEGHTRRNLSPPQRREGPSKLGATILLVCMMLLTIPSAALVIGELPPPDRSEAWKLFLVGASVGVAGAIALIVWMWRDPRAIAPAPRDRLGARANSLTYVVGFCAGLGLLFDRLVGGVGAGFIRGLAAGVFPLFFVGFYLLRVRPTESAARQRDDPSK